MDCLHQLPLLVTLAPLSAGKVSILEDTALEAFQSQVAQTPEATSEDDPRLGLTAGDVYKELRLRGYDYAKTFQGILESSGTGEGPPGNRLRPPAIACCSVTE